MDVLIDQIKDQVAKTSKAKLNAYRDNLNNQFRMITPYDHDDRKVIGNMSGESNMFDWTVETFFLIYENVDAKGSDAMRGDEYEMAEAWGAWRFIYHLLSAFIEGLPEDAKAHRMLFKQMPVGQALVNVILLSTHRTYGAWRSKEDLENSFARQQKDSGYDNDSHGCTFMLARGDQAKGCSLLGQGYLENDLMKLFEDRTIKEMIAGQASKQTSVVISGENLKVHE
tara:strand:- start:178 stop:855 length:678 start_codon:yes stop_codon:yes gene_type:complete